METLIKTNYKLTILASVFVSLHAISVPIPDSWYVGAKVGWISASNACELHATSCDNDTAGVGLYTGYTVNNWLALEAGYDYLGDIKADYPSLGYPDKTAIYKGELQGFELIAKPYWKINDNVSWYGKAGTLIWNMDVTGDEVGFTHKASDSDWSMLLGTGVEYGFDRNCTMRLEYQWVNNVGGRDTGGADLNMVNLGVSYHFVSAPRTTSLVEPAPLVPVTAIEVQTAWAFNGASFASNSSELSTELQLALASVLDRLQSYSQAHLNIRTHTDSRGSDIYNQRLSDQRAVAVKNYFISHGIPTSQLSTEGWGEAQPIASNSTAEGRYKNRRIELISPAFDVMTSIPPQGGL
ncbi:OmpA family protein [Aeromonas salmonicida]